MDGVSLEALFMGALTIIMAVMGWWLRTHSWKVDDLMRRTTTLEAQHVDTEKVRSIVKEAVDPIMDKLEHQEDVLNEIRISIASSFRRRKEDYDKEGE